MDLDMEDLIFFDSHGIPWIACSPDEPGAEAFGPRGCARRCDDSFPSYLQALKAGRIHPEEVNGFSVPVSNS